MTVRELWDVSPKCHVFIRVKGGGTREYIGVGSDGDAVVGEVLATRYPMYGHVLEVTLEKDIERWRM